MPTIRDLDKAGRDLRVWCFRCVRGERVDSIMWQLFEKRGWDHELGAAARRFRCKGCDRSDQVLIIPATRPKRDISNAPTDLVASFFHKMRSAAKREHRR